MNLLVITPVNPFPLNSGGAQALFNMIDNIRGQYNISLLCFYSCSRSDSRNLSTLKCLYPDVRIYNYSYLRRLRNISFLYSKVVRVWNKVFFANSVSFKKDAMLDNYGYEIDDDLLNYVNNIIKSDMIEVVQVEFYPLIFLACGINPHVKKIFVQHEIRYVRNELALRAFKPLTFYDNYRLELSKATEIAMCNLYDVVITLTDVDKEKLLSEGVTAKICTSPAAVLEKEEFIETKKYEFNNVLTFIGGISHTPNAEGLIWFLDNVWSIILAECPAIELKVVGSGWDKASKRNWKNVHFLGFVEDLSSVLRNTILIVPILTGSGMRMKILDGVKIGVPFVTTSVGVEGLNFKDNESCYIADSAIEFANKVVSLIFSTQKQCEFISSSQIVYKNELSTKLLVRKRLNIYNEIVKDIS